MRSCLIPLCIVAAGLLSASAAFSDVKLPTVFGDHMVLQQGKALPLWGTADPGEEVTVSLGKIQVATRAGEGGRWQITLPPIHPGSPDGEGQPMTLTVSGDNTITIQDVLVGEVWLCSGQSNMHWPLSRAVKGKEELAGANHPEIRLLNLQGGAYPSRHAFSPEELARCTAEHYFEGAWTVCSPETAKDFSAVAYFFGKALRTRLKVPVGLIQNALGGSPTEAWISREALGADPDLAPILEDWFQNKLVMDWCRERAAENLAESPRSLEGVHHPFEPAFLYDAGVSPLIPFAFRGVIWYQGESNAHNAVLHDQLFSALVYDWRRRWGQGDFPFLYVQLAGLGTRPEWPAFRESQRRCLDLPNTGMAVTIDLGHPTDVHPRNKRDVGSRLARWALWKSYGMEVVPSGPLYRSMSIEGDRILIAFDHTAGGLAAGDGKGLIGFEVAGEDGVFKAASAEIRGDRVAVFSSEVSRPVAARYGWAPMPACNLINGEDLPASPFTTEEPSTVNTKKVKK